MSLQVWLPLTKDLRQQGLNNNYSVSTSTATYSSTEGKLGGCYNFSGTTGNGILLSGDVTIFMNTYINNHSWSMCAWVKNSVSDRSTPVISLTYGLRMTAGATTGVSLYNSSRTVSCTSSVATGDGKWHHMVATYNVNTNAIKIYVDGINTGNATYTSGYTYASSWTNGLFIGRDPNNSTANASYFYQGAMNDVRIYDHCLSPMEVKELAKGLVLHYPLNRQGWGQENLITNSKLDGSWTYPSSSYSDKYSPITTIVPSATQYTLSFDAKSTVNGDKIRTHYYSPNTTTTCVSSQGITKTAADGNMDFTLTTQWKRYWVIYTQTETTAVKHLICPRLVSGQGTGTVSVKNVKFEEGSIATPWCPNSSDTLATTMGLNSTAEYDCSGFCNNGTRIGTFTWTSDTPKYSVSTNATGGASTYLVGPVLPAEAKTVALWIKCTSKANNGAIFNDKTSGLQIGLLNSLLYMNSAASTAGFTTTHWVNGEWNHVVAINNNGTRSLYVNGQAETQSGASNYYIHNADNCWLWNRSYNNSYPFTGSLCDLRVYATALSADDVKSLYQNCATIDPDGTIRGQIRS